MVEETAHIVNLYRTPQLEEGVYRDAIIQNNFDDKIMLVNADGTVRKLDLVTGLGAAKEINGAIDEDTRYIYIPGAFTNSVISDISLRNLKQVQFVLKDPTKIFVNAMDWGIFRKKGFRVNVLKILKSPRLRSTHGRRQAIPLTTGCCFRKCRRRYRIFRLLM